MNKIIVIVAFVLALVLMEGISWWVGNSSLNDVNVVPSSLPNPESSSVDATFDVGQFPPPSTEVVNGVTERTIHIGVRQYEWDPKIIRAQQGELVRLIVHNADVKHGLVIPELGVQEDIPEDGAVITFQVSKKGTFEFFCSVYCGVGHAEMQGRIIVE